MDYCLYCQKGQTKLKRHCSIEHKDEDLVKKIDLLLKSEGRTKSIEQLRNRGNLQHNHEVWASGAGEIVPRRRTTEDECDDIYLP